MSFCFGSSYDDDPHDYHAEHAQHQRLQKLEAFYKAIVDLTIHHDTLVSSDAGMEEDYAVVFPNKLGKELEKVDPKWYENA